MMLNLYAVLDVPVSASINQVQQAIEQAQTQARLPLAVLESARFYLLDVNRRQAYDRALSTSMANNQSTDNWQQELAKQQSELLISSRQTLPVTATTVSHQTATPNTLNTSPTNKKQRMQAWHWFWWVVCLAITGVLVAVLWEMAQVQMHQNHQLTQAQQLQQQQRLPEDWPTWTQEDGLTYLRTQDVSQARLGIEKHPQQDLPVLTFFKHKNIDCAERGNHACEVNFVFDDQDPQSFRAQIVGNHLVFNDTKQLPLLMHHLSRATQVQTSFPRADDLPTLVFARHFDTITPLNTPKAKQP